MTQVSTTEPAVTSVSPTDDPQLSMILDRFDRDWAKGGVRPGINSYLPAESETSGLPRRELLIALVMIDLERRWRSGGGDLPTIATTDRALPQKPILEDYLARFPELSSHADLPTELIAQEYRVRKQWGDRPGHDEYLRRFPAHSPKLTSVLSTVDRESAMEPTLDVVQGSGPSDADRSRFPRTIPAAVCPATIGDRVRYFGDYELIEEIARGGMGVVFKARQVKLNRVVALKMILSGEFAGEEEVQRFKTEAKAAANLDHAGIVPIYEIGEHKGQHYFSMGFVEGKSLADRVKAGPLPAREAAEIVKKVAEAVAYAHSKGVIHRDLKPANVLVDATGEPRITDFGLAKQVESKNDLTRTGVVMGTPSYMSPEQASGKTDGVGSRSDVYSLGAILYCLLTGRPPFHAASTFETLKRVIEEPPVLPRRINARIPRDLETICLKCLGKDPRVRFPTASSLGADLHQFLVGGRIASRRKTLFEHITDFARYHEASLYFGALLAVTIAWLCVIRHPVPGLNTWLYVFRTDPDVPSIWQHLPGTCMRVALALSCGALTGVLLGLVIRYADALCVTLLSALRFLRRSIVAISILTFLLLNCFSFTGNVAYMQLAGSALIAATVAVNAAWTIAENQLPGYKAKDRFSVKFLEMLRFEIVIGLFIAVLTELIVRQGYGEAVVGIGVGYLANYAFQASQFGYFFAVLSTLYFAALAADVGIAIVTSLIRRRPVSE